jgi:ectoine hydroxylase-related dioxygenase (phytanoyl-CoA dioxygenase family)
MGISVVAIAMDPMTNEFPAMELLISEIKRRVPGNLPIDPATDHSGSSRPVPGSHLLRHRRCEVIRETFTIGFEGFSLVGSHLDGRRGV